MKTTKPSSKYFGDFRELFKIQVHQLLALGYQDALQEIKSGNPSHRQEPAITGFIIKAIKERKRSVPRRPAWFKYYTVHDDPPVEKEGKSGKSRPRADIIIEANWLGNPEYIFEAKRLRRSGHNEKNYTNSDGLGCFISGRYASRYDEASMIGYVQSDSLEYWSARIKQEIENDSQNLCLKTSQTEVNFQNSFPLEWKSEHLRNIIGRSITVYHIMLDCQIV